MDWDPLHKFLSFINPFIAKNALPRETVKGLKIGEDITMIHLSRRLSHTPSRPDWLNTGLTTPLVNMKRLLVAAADCRAAKYIA